MESKIVYEIEHHLTESMEGFLINAVQKHPILYEKSDAYIKIPGYNEKCAVAWNKISDELNLEVESCKTLWLCTKQKFIKYRKKMENGDMILKEWPIYDTLKAWLDKHIKRRRTRNEIFKQIRNHQSLDAKPQQQSNQQITPIELFNTEAEFEENENSIDWEKMREEGKKKDLQMNLRARKDIVITIPKKKMKIEQECESESSVAYNENDSEIFTELEATEMDEIREQQQEQQQQQPQPSDQTKLVEIQTIEEETKQTEQCREVVLEANFDKLEQVIDKCVSLAEKCITKSKGRDATELFGDYIAAMVRELPQEKQLKVRTNILQYTSELVMKITSKN